MSFLSGLLSTRIVDIKYCIKVRKQRVRLRSRIERVAVVLILDFIACFLTSSMPCCKRDGESPHGLVRPFAGGTSFKVLELLAKVVAVIVLSIVALDETRGADEGQVVGTASTCNVRVWLDVLTCNGVVSLMPVLSGAKVKHVKLVRRSSRFQHMKPHVNDVPSSTLSESIVTVLVLIFVILDISTLNFVNWMLRGNGITQ